MMNKRELTLSGIEVSSRPAELMASTKDNEQNNIFVRAGRDVHSVILDNLPTIQDCVSLASCCFTLWSKSQAGLFNRLLREAHNYSSIHSLSYLADMLEFNPILRRNGINYRHLATMLTRARTLLSTSIRTDPYCVWKIAAICGLKAAVKELLGTEYSTKVDPYGRKVLDYYALGGQLECIKEYLDEHPELLPLDTNALRNLARMAAIGGHIHVLKYLRDDHGFQLNYVFPPVSSDDLPETLLTAAVSGGDIETVNFLKEPVHGIDSNVGVNLALIASDHGQWHLYDSLAEENNPIQDEHDALIVAQDAARYGKIEKVISLMKLYDIPTKELVLDIINGGNPQLFWHALNNDWFTLESTFENGATVQHLLARQGHFELLKAVLKDNRAIKANHPLDGQDEKPKAAYVVDENKQSLLHYVAVGGHYGIYCYLLDTYYKNKGLVRDSFGSTVAHCAGGSGSVWFLKKLFNGENGSELILSKDNNDGLILHDAANCGEPNILFMMVEEFHIDPKSKDGHGKTPLHVLANLAQDNIWIWDVVKLLLQRYPDDGLADIPDGNGKTVREIFAEWKALNNISGELFDSITPQQTDAALN